MTIAVVGGGCIGLGLAGELAGDRSVHLFDKGRMGGGSTYAAAGMIAPITEAEYGEERLLELGLRSRELYPDFIESLEAETGINVGFRTNGTVVLAFDQPGESELDRKIDHLSRLGLDYDRLSAEQVRKLEPRISSYVTRAIAIPSERQVDNRRLAEALEKRCKQRDVALHDHEEVIDFSYRDGSIVELQTEKGRYQPDLVIVCAGAYSGTLDGLSEADRMPVRPVKGEALSVRLDKPPEIEHVLRAPDVYCVPKEDGRLVIGGTMREEGYDRTVTAGGVLDLLHDAYEVVPFIREKELLETWAGLRPASRDSRPILGPSSTTDNLGFATGHYRNGILLTPVTIQLLAEWVETSTVPDAMTPYLPSRFQEV
jgi:glycine oxidase